VGELSVSYGYSLTGMWIGEKLDGLSARLSEEGVERTCYLRGGEAKEVPFSVRLPFRSQKVLMKFSGKGEGGNHSMTPRKRS